MFINLKNIFGQLIELNGKNYAHLLFNKKQKPISMGKILADTKMMHKKMLKTVKTS